MRRGRRRKRRRGRFDVGRVPVLNTPPCLTDCPWCTPPLWPWPSLPPPPPAPATPHPPPQRRHPALAVATQFEIESKA